MKKRWFQAEDGSYYRNCNLILAEMKKCEAKPWRWLTWRKLQAEWDEAWCEGPIRKTALGRGDIVVTPLPMRVAYPQHPILWTLDER